MNNTCDCLDWHQDLGGHAENIVNNVVQWLCFGLSIANLAYFAWSTFRATCGWEEVYVCSVELTKISIEMWHEYSNPFTIYTSTGRWVTWLRYAEWLMTCPVILIHLSNLSGLTHDYSARTMGLLVSDIGTIVLGISAAFATGPLKAIFFCFACCYGATTMFHAAKVFYDSHNEVPKGACQTEVKWLAGLYFFSWNMYPVIWLLSQEGYQVLTWHEAGILYNIADILAKNIWTLIGHDLRLRIHKFVAAGGKLNKASAHNTVEADNESKKSSPSFFKSIFGGRALTSVRSDGRQEWVVDVQDFAGNTMILLAEIHQALRNRRNEQDTEYLEEPLLEDSPVGKATPIVRISGPGSSVDSTNRSKSMQQRRKSMGDAIANAVLSNMSTDGGAQSKRSSQLNSRASIELVHALLEMQSEGAAMSRSAQNLTSDSAASNIMAGSNKSRRSESALKVLPVNDVDDVEVARIATANLSRQPTALAEARLSAPGRQSTQGMSRQGTATSLPASPMAWQDNNTFRSTSKFLPDPA